VSLEFATLSITYIGVYLQPLFFLVLKIKNLHTLLSSHHSLTHITTYLCGLRGSLNLILMVDEGDKGFEHNKRCDMCLSISLHVRCRMVLSQENDQ
jgi:hypothetical protein